MKRIIAVVLAALTLMSCVGCADKTPKTADEFKTFMENKSYTVQDVTSTQDATLVETGLLAIKDDYQLEFFDLVDEATAIGSFQLNESNFDEEHSVKTSSVSVSMGNHAYYAFTADGNFHMVARIADTMLFCEVDEEHKDEIVAILEELGYK